MMSSQGHLESDRAYRKRRWLSFLLLIVPVTVLFLFILGNYLYPSEELGNWVAVPPNREFSDVLLKAVTSWISYMVIVPPVFTGLWLMRHPMTDKSASAAVASCLPTVLVCVAYLLSR